MARELTLKDLEGAAVWPGRVSRTGTVVPGFIVPEKWMFIFDRVKWSRSRKYHQGTLPPELIDWLGTPNPHTTAPSQCQAHQLTYRLANGEWPRGTIDHVANSSTYVNMPSNLRLATGRRQATNVRPRSDGRERGVWWHKRGKKWEVRVTSPDGIKRSYGYFASLDDANAVAAKVHAENAAIDDAECERLKNGDSYTRNLPRGVLRSGNRDRNPFMARAAKQVEGKRVNIYLGSFPAIELAAAAAAAARTLKGNGVQDIDAWKLAARFAADQLARQKASTGQQLLYLRYESDHERIHGR